MVGWLGWLGWLVAFLLACYLVVGTDRERDRLEAITEPDGLIKELEIIASINDEVQLKLHQRGAQGGPGQLPRLWEKKKVKAQLKPEFFFFFVLDGFVFVFSQRCHRRQASPASQT